VDSAKGADCDLVCNLVSGLFSRFNGKCSTRSRPVQSSMLKVKGFPSLKVPESDFRRPV
jgi:hypothetical protein